MVMGKGRTSSFIAIAMMAWYGGYLCDTFLSEEKKDIAKSSLDDYKSWVGEWVTKIQSADGQGDTKSIYKAVKKLEAKPEKAQKNLTMESCFWEPRKWQPQQR